MELIFTISLNCGQKTIHKPTVRGSLERRDDDDLSMLEMLEGMLQMINLIFIICIHF